MLLVQISDLHCGSRLNRQKLQRSIYEINQMDPDAILVTGDLTENGLKEEFEEAKRFLEQLDCRRLVVGSGNHDSRTTGYLLFPLFFGEPSSVTYIEEAAIVMLNSSRPDRDDGEIGFNQGLWVKRQLEEHPYKTKIVALHHHLVPVPDTGMETNITCDAGDFIRLLLDQGVSLVLCGHRHRPWTWNLEGLQIVYAGTISSRRLRGFYDNSYNIIRIESGETKVTLKVVGGEEYNFETIEKRQFDSLPPKISES